MKFELSKKLLFSHLRSSAVARVFDNIDHIKGHRHYDVLSNNDHKGTNYGFTGQCREGTIMV
eukprot:2436228-Ditylum_brightwellii.AAC.1